MPTQAERTKNTCGEIIRVARNLFAEAGFAKVSLAEIVKQAGVTTGAIYHHFGDKKGLFVAVAEDVEQEILNELVEKSSRSELTFESFEASILHTLEICSRPDIQRIVFRDAPTVIGVFEWRRIEVQYGFGIMIKSICQLADKNLIRVPNPEMVAQILLGAIIEAAHLVSTSEHSSSALAQGKLTIQMMLSSFKA